MLGAGSGTMAAIQQALGEHLANDACPDSPTRAAWQVACPASNSWNGRASQSAIGGKKFSAGCMK
jgi:hypothetical protein